MRTRLALQQTWSFTVLLLLLFWTAHEITSHSLQRDLDDRVSDRSATVHSLLSVRNASGTWVDEGTDLEGSEVLARGFYQVLDLHGRVLAASGDDGLREIPVTATSLSAAWHRPSWETVSLDRGVRVRVMNRVIPGREYQQSIILRVGLLMEDVDQRDRLYLLFFIIAIPIIVAIHAITAWEMSGAALKPIASLTSAAQNIDSTDLKRRFPPTQNNDELAHLTSALNAMIERIEGPFQRMREFLPNISHELRRPLTNLRAESEFALRHSMVIEGYREVLSHQIENVDLITATMSELMELASYDNGSRPSTRQDQNVSELLQASVDAMLPNAIINKVELSATIPPGIMGAVDTCQLCRAMQNLIDNAIKYNHEGGTVQVAVEQRNSFTMIQVSDDGMGIPTVDLPRIFDRSYRSRQARASGIKGTGLGLYFVKMVVDAHRGLINVDSVEGKGTAFRITLPATRLGDSCEPGLCPGTCDTCIGSGNHQN